ncbi:Sulfite exporter TauE/SafE [Lotmaria passim]
MLVKKKRMMSRTAALAIAVVLLVVCGGAVASEETTCAFRTQRVQCGDLACDKDTNVCIMCRTNDDCYPAAMRCDTSSGKCKVSSFTSRFGWGTVLAMIGGCIVCSIGVIAGVGGGGILVPMFCGCLSIPMQFAVGLSQCTICGQSTLNMYISVQQKYPDRSWDRPLINYQYLSLLLPLGLLGTLVGGILSKMCPDVLRLVLLFVLLSAVLYRTVQKMKAQYAKDKEAQEVTVEAGDAAAAAPVASGSPRREYGSKDETANNDAPEVEKTPSTTCEATAASPTSEAIQAAPVHAPQPQYPQQELMMNFLCFFVLLLFNIFRTWAPCGGFLYWLCVFIPLVLLAAVFHFNREKLRQLSETDPAQLSFAWNQNTSVSYPMVAVVAGAAAAMLGIGGGLVLGFVLYEVGLVPQEASVTGGMATFFIAFSSALQLLVTGSLVVDFGLAFFVVGLFATALGQFVFMKYIKEHGLSYLIIGALATIVGGSLVVLGGYGIYNAVDSSRAGGDVMAFGKLCARAK